MAEIYVGFNPDEIDDRNFTADALKEEFELLEARLLGRADDLSGSFDSSAEHFTNLIAWNIKFKSEEDYQLWVDAATNIRFLAGVSDRWSKCIKSFWEERSSQMREFREAKILKESEVPEKFTRVTAGHPKAGLLDFDANKARKLYDELWDIRMDLWWRAKENMERFEDEADEVAKMLREGATDVNVQKLIDGGNSRWGFANIDPEQYMNFDHELTPENAEEVAEELDEYWSGGKPLDSRYDELLLFMGMISANAMYAQQDEGSLEPGEIEFLKSFYDYLEEKKSGRGGMLSVTGDLNIGDFSEAEHERALGVLGDGLLALSDPRLGGGYYDLPESVRHAAEGMTLGSADGRNGAPQDVVAKFNALGALLGNANENMQPGYGLAATLSLAVANDADRIENDPVFGGQVNEGLFESLIDVGSRNIDANADILSGDYVHPNMTDGDGNILVPNQFGDWEVHDSSTKEAREEAMEKQKDFIADSVVKLFTHEWNDSGEAASGLIDWIGDDRRFGDEDDQERAGRSAAGLIDIVTDSDRFDLMTKLVDKEEALDGTYNKQSIMGANSGIAAALGDVFDAYVDSFGTNDNPEGVEFLKDQQGEHLTAVDDHGNYIQIPHGDRVRFLELIVADPDAAAGAFGSLEERRMDNMADMWMTGEFSRDSANSDGVLSTIFNSAIDSHGQNVEATAAQQREAEVAMKKQGWDLLFGELTGKIPGPAGVYGSLASQIIESSVESSVSPLPSEDDLQNIVDRSVADYPPSADHVRYDAQLSLIRHLYLEGEINASDIPEYTLTSEGNIPTSIENLGGPADTGTMTQDLEDDLFGDVAEAQIELIEEYVNEFAQGRVDAHLIID